MALLQSPSSAQPVSQSLGCGAAFLGGTCSISNGQVVNVYWDTSIGQWDTDIVQSFRSRGPGSPPTHALLDEDVQVLTHSTYFSGLQEYQVASVKALPSLAVGSCAPQPSSVADLWNNPSQIDSVIKCLENANPSLKSSGQGSAAVQTIFNFMILPLPGDVTWCQTGVPNEPNGVGAWHGDQSEVYSIIPTGCNTTTASVEYSVSHELVEALTDPDTWSGWADASNEIADICELKSPPFAKFGPNGFVALYWSNKSVRCISSLGNTPPGITSAAVCGSGQSLTVTLGGTFPFPTWFLSSGAFGGEALYVSLQVTTPTNSWTAGLPFEAPGATVQLGSSVPGVTANANSMVVSGFSGQYGSALSDGTLQTAPPGATIEVTVVDPDSGSFSSKSATVPNPASASDLEFFPVSSRPYLFIKQTGWISGILKDANGCVEGDVPVQLSTTGGGSFSPAQPVTDSVGIFSTNYTAPGLAGMQSVTTMGLPQTLSIPVYPIETNLSPAFGGVNGSPNLIQAPQIIGAGFRSPASAEVDHGNNKVTQVSPAPDGSFMSVKMPASPLPGDHTGPVDVVPVVDGVTGLPLTYTYIIPDKPVFFPRLGCGFDEITLSAYNANGTIDPVQIQLSGPPNSIKTSTGTANNVGVKSGGNVSIVVGGTFTATAQTGKPPQPQAQQSFFVLPRGDCTAASSFPKGSFEPNVSPQTGSLPPHTGFCDFCGPPNDYKQPVVVWGNDLNGPSLGMAGDSSLSQRYTVDVASPSLSAQLIRAAPDVLLAAGGGTRAIFRSPIVEIQASKGTKDGSLQASASLLIPVSPSGSGSNARQLRIFRLGTPDGASVWSESGVTNQRLSARFVHAVIHETGKYAAVEIQP